MTDAAPQEGLTLEGLVAQVADEFLDRQRRGERPDVEEYAARHPQAAEVLRKVLASLRILGPSGSPGPGGPAAASDPPMGGTLGDFRILSRPSSARGRPSSASGRTATTSGSPWRSASGRRTTSPGCSGCWRSARRTCAAGSGTTSTGCGARPSPR
jgi:hypothetical protein